MNSYLYLKTNGNKVATNVRVLQLLFRHPDKANGNSFRICGNILTREYRLKSIIYSSWKRLSTHFLFYLIIEKTQYCCILLSTEYL